MGEKIRNYFRAILLYLAKGVSPWLLWNDDRKPEVADRSVSVWWTLVTLKGGIKSFMRISVITRLI